MPKYIKVDGEYVAKVVEGSFEKYSVFNGADNTTTHVSSLSAARAECKRLSEKYSGSGIFPHLVISKAIETYYVDCE